MNPLDFKTHKILLFSFKVSLFSKLSISEMAVDFYKFPKNEKTKDDHNRKSLVVVLNPNRVSPKGSSMANLIHSQGTQQLSEVYPLLIMQPK